jgi:hypothetical protein
MLWTLATIWHDSLGSDDRNLTRSLASHVSGTISQCGITVPSVWIKFDGANSQIIRANGSGAYQINLPLGNWIATTPPNATDLADESLSRPRHFRLTVPGSVVLNLYLRPPVMCDLIIVTESGRAPRREQESGRDAACWGEESFPIPSSDGTPFEVNLGGLHIGNTDPCQTTAPPPLTKALAREYATYNLLSLEADKIDYHPSTKIMEASGGVVIEDESGEHKERSTALYLQDGRAVPVDPGH